MSWIGGLIYPDKGGVYTHTHKNTHRGAHTGEDKNLVVGYVPFWNKIVTKKGASK